MQDWAHLYSRISFWHRSSVDNESHIEVSISGFVISEQLEIHCNKNHMLGQSTRSVRSRVHCSSSVMAVMILHILVSIDKMIDKVVGDLNGVCGTAGSTLFLANTLIQTSFGDLLHLAQQSRV